MLVEDGEGERLYLVVETTGSAFLSDLRNAERAKVECGKAHFKALGLANRPPSIESLHRGRIVRLAKTALVRRWRCLAVFKFDTPR